MLLGPLLSEVDARCYRSGKIHGNSAWQIIWKVLLPKRSLLILGAALVITTIVGYSAMSGFVGGGGLGDIAIRYGYYRYQADMMIVTVIIMVHCLYRKSVIVLYAVQTSRTAGNFFAFDA